MVRIVQFRSRSRLYEDAALWLARLDKGISAAERETLRQWLEKDPRRRAVFPELAALWDELDVLAELAELFPLAQPAQPVRRSATLRLAGAAASIVALAAIGWWIDEIGPDDIPTDTTASVAQTLKEDLQTEIGGREIKVLPDGSVVTLNTDTELTVEYSATSRDIFLKRGEANFSVARNEAQPFRVHVGERIIQAVGTAFNVQLRPSGDVEVAVTQGRVRVSGSLSVVPERLQLMIEQIDLLDTTLGEGEAVSIGAMMGAEGSNIRPQISQLKPVDLDMRLAWQRGMLIFQDETLRTVLAEVSRYTTVELVLADDRLETVRVGGYFRTGDIDGLLVALRDNFQIDSAAVGDNRILLSAAR